MMLRTTGLRYRIDYMSGLRYVFSPAYRAEIRNTCRGRTCLKVLYMFGDPVSTTVMISALLFVALAIQGLLR